MGPGDEVGRFRLEGRLADGSWRATAIRSGAGMRVRVVEPFTEAEFLATGRALQQLEDPAIVPVADAGVLPDGTAWIAEPWQPGETLADRVGRMGPLPADHLFTVAAGLFAGLAAAHARGVRDGAITPERLKILGDPPHTVLLVQPGLGALVTDLVPDPDFAAPEGPLPTVAADLFGAAATLCYAALGTSVPAGQALELAAGHLPGNLVDVLRPCLDPDPQDRPHSIAPLQRAVEALRARAATDATLLRPPTAEPAPVPPPPVSGPKEAVATRPGLMPPRLADLRADAAPPREPEGRVFEATLAEPVSPHFDFSADATLPPDEARPLATLTLPQAPPIPERARPNPGHLPTLGTPVSPVAPTVSAHPPALELASAPPPQAPPPPASAEPPEPELAAPARARGPSPQTERSLPERPSGGRPSTSGAPSRAPLAVAIGLLAMGVGAVVLWWAQRQPAEGAPSGGPEPVAEIAAPASEPSVEAGDAEPPRESYVRVQVEPGPARFVQVPTGKVLCESAEICSVPIDVPTRVEKAGHRTLLLSGDDLYDRRGGRWRVRLYRGR